MMKLQILKNNCLTLQEKIMVKKIRLVEEEKDDEAMDAGDTVKAVLELLKSMDWKLWETLQTMQRLEKNLRVMDNEEENEEKE